jgi:hypothetical protein
MHPPSATRSSLLTHYLASKISSLVLDLLPRLALISDSVSVLPDMVFEEEEDKRLSATAEVSCFERVLGAIVAVFLGMLVGLVGGWMSR